MNGFGTIDKKDINMLISSIENKINFIRNDISQNVTSLKNQLNACNEELNRLKKLVIQVTDYNDTEYKKIENRINEFAKDIEDIKSKLNTIQYNEIAAGKCASGINEYPIYAKYAENDTNGNIIPEYYAAKFDLSNVSSTLSADYTRKIAESSSGGMSALSSVSAQLVDSIEKETQERQSKDEGLEMSINNESIDRIAKDNELEERIETEKSSREEAISEIQQSLKKEETRATVAEESIKNDLSKEIEVRTNAITELEGKIKEEETRATNAEQELQTSIVNETDTRKQAISQLQEAITIEQKRAETAESNETSRAKEEENKLRTNLKGEIERATGIETGLRTDLDDEITRAKGVETTLQNKIDSEETLRETADNTIKANLSDEITRATGVETTLTNNLNDEINRAENAESELDEKIDTNKNEIYDTISSISGQLSSELISEYNDRVSADISLQNQIDTIEATQNVIDLVADYAALTAYDTTNVKVNDKIQVICDETSANQTTIYSWNNNTWNGIGMFGPYYTKSQVEEEITKAINTEKTERESDIEELNTNKQNNLTAGDGIDLTNDTISVDTDIIATKELVENVSSTIQSKLDNKKDLQEVKSYSGSQTKTITNISQDKNGVITVNYADIDLPQEVPNVEITSEDKSVQVTETTDVQTNTKKFDLSVNVNDTLEYGQFRANNVTSKAQLTKINGNLDLNNYAIKLKKGNSYHFTVRGSYVANSAVNTNSTIVYIEPISFNNINVNVDNTITDAQFFEISYDVYKLSSDKNYNVTFSSISGGKVSELFVEVHNLNGVSVNGSGGGSGGDGKTYTGIAPVIVDNDSNVIEVDIMKGASSNNDGKSGTVPKPLSGEENKFLRADGTWVQINQLSDGNEVTDMVTFFSTNRDINLCNIYNNDRYYSTTYSLPSSMGLNSVRSYYIDDIMYFFTETKINQIYATNGIYLTFNNEVPRIIFKYKNKYFVGTSGDINHEHNIYVSSNNKLSDLTSVYSATSTTDLVGIYYIFECNNQLFAISTNDNDKNYKILKYNESNNVFELFNNDIYSTQPSYLFYINGNYIVPQYENNRFVLLNSDGSFSRYLYTPSNIEICRCKIDEHNFIDQHGNIVSITDDYVIQLHAISYPSMPLVRTFQCIRDTVNNQIIFNGTAGNTVCNYFINENNYTISKIVELPTSINNNSFRYFLYTKAYSYGVQSDWNENNVNSPAYINNKPDLDWKEVDIDMTKTNSSEKNEVAYFGDDGYIGYYVTSNSLILTWYNDSVANFKMWANDGYTDINGAGPVALSAQFYNGNGQHNTLRWKLNSFKCIDIHFNPDTNKLYWKEL